MRDGGDVGEDFGHPLEPSVVRVRNAAGGVVGAGFLAADGAICTCAHVVADALGQERETAARPDSEVRLDFPFVDGVELAARIEAWVPIGADGSGDVAVLRPTTAAPSRAQPIRLLSGIELAGRAFSALGFPTQYDVGQWAHGVLGYRRANGTVQIEAASVPGFRVQAGYSGAPVWDAAHGGVVGMVVTAEREAGAKVAFMIPVAALARAWPALEQRPLPPCPYRGLFPFREEDAPFFRGRERDTERLAEAVRSRPLTVVIGPSGSGKSSLVFAGLVPRLRRESGWLVVSFRPGDQPFDALAEALVALLDPDQSATARQIEIPRLAAAVGGGSRLLRDLVGSVVRHHPSATRLLLVVDQLEELYALCDAAEVRRRFLDELLGATRPDDYGRTGELVLVGTLRADFCDAALGYAPFAQALQDGSLLLGPMGRDELRAAIEAPARDVRVTLEPGLTERILEDVGEDPGRLPLLEFALTELWERPEHGRLTHTAYDAMGGVDRALAEHAEQVYAALSDDGRERARRVFLQLVRPGEGTGDTRRRATRAEVGEENWGLVTRLADERLVVTGDLEASGRATVEIVHEALIEKWQRLRSWVDSVRDFRTWQEGLRTALRQWDDSGRDADTLLRGGPLARAEDRLGRHGDELGRAEREFIRTSLRRRDRDRRRQIAGLAGGLALAIGLAVFSLVQWQIADRQRQIATGREIAARAGLVRDRDPERAPLGLTLATEAMRRMRSVGERAVEVDRALREGLASLPRSAWSLNRENPVTATALSPSGDYLATTESDSRSGTSEAYTTYVWDVADGRTVGSVPHDRDQRVAAVDPFGAHVATSGRLAGTPVVHLWDVAERRDVATIEHQGTVTAAAFSPDGIYLATATNGGQVQVWDVTHRRPLVSRVRVGAVHDVRFSPDGRYLVAAGANGFVSAWDARDTQGRWPETGSFKNADQLTAVAVSPNGKLVAAATPGNLPAGQRRRDAIVLWDFTKGNEIARIPDQEAVSELAFSPDGRDLISISVNAINRADSALIIRILDVSSRREVSRVSYGGEGARGSFVTPSPAISASGRYFALGQQGRRINIWEMTDEAVMHLAHDSAVMAVGFSADGRELLTASESGAIHAWNVTTGHHVARADLGTRPAGGGLSSPAAALAPGPRYLAVKVGTGVRLVEVPGGQRVAELAGESPLALAISSDGAHLVTGTTNGLVRLREVATGIELARATAGSVVRTAAFSGDGHAFAFGADNGALEIWDVPTRRSVRQMKLPGDVSAVALGPDGRQVAAGGVGRGALGLWTLPDGPQVVLPHDAKVTALAFSPDGRYLATASADQAVRIWNIGEEREVARMTHDAFTANLTFSPDGRRLAAASRDAAARVWLWQPDDLIDAACGHLTANLGEDEWRRYLPGQPFRKTCEQLP